MDSKDKRAAPCRIQYQPWSPSPPQNMLMILAHSLIPSCKQYFFWMAEILNLKLIVFSFQLQETSLRKYHLPQQQEVCYQNSVLSIICWEVFCHYRGLTKHKIKQTLTKVGFDTSMTKHTHILNSVYFMRSLFCPLNCEFIIFFQVNLI